MPGNKDYYAEGIVVESVLGNFACFSSKKRTQTNVLQSSGITIDE